MRHILIKLIILVSLFDYGTCLATDYYISNDGEDRNSGKDPSSPIGSMEKISSLDLLPGDRILFKSGDSFQGMLEFNNLSGSETSPVILDRYGDGPNPIIDGNGNDAAIYFLNPSHITIQNLDIINPAGRYGILMKARNAGKLENIVIRHANIYDVFDESFKRSEPPKTIGGIVFSVEKDQRPTWWEGILIENCEIMNLGSCGISIGSDYKVNKEIGDNEKTYPIRGVRITKNKIHDIVRDGAIIRQCYGAIMEYNEVYRTGLVAVSNGLWFYDSDSCYIQHNTGHHCKAAFDKDGAPFSLDNHCTNSVIRFNYSFENEGAGYMLFGRDSTGNGCMIYKNISYNDHTNNISDGIGSIAIVSRVSGAIVKDNIIIAGPATKSILGHRNWGGFPIGVSYENNIFVGNGNSFFNRNVLSGAEFINNLFINIADLPDELADTNNTIGNYYGDWQKMIENYDKLNGHNAVKFMD